MQQCAIRREKTVYNVYHEKENNKFSCAGRTNSLNGHELPIQDSLSSSSSVHQQCYNIESIETINILEMDENIENLSPENNESVFINRRINEYSKYNIDTL